MENNHILLVDRWLEETRMARIQGGVLEDFDHEIDSQRLKKGNIYIGRVMRIEPSLQAVFVDYGYEKHGFLAFSDIALPSSTPPIPTESVQDAQPEPSVVDIVNIQDDSASEAPSPPLPTRASSKKLFTNVQEWSQNNPLIMVQVLKDERGSKGAALTTFISLSGRYGFFLPNTPNSTGVSKKITTNSVRQHLQDMLKDLQIPTGMSLILRSASADRKQTEIKRDYDYLMSKWNDLQEKNRDHVGLILAEDPLLIRCLRDSRIKDINAIYIEGKDLYKQARHYVKAVMPSYLPHIHLGANGLFASHRVDEQITGLYSPRVQLPSGGSVVITPTEALVSIDVNSAKATQKKNIYDTALATNLEAATMIARQLRLRDLAGLIVIDFIDVPPNKRPIIEKALKEALAQDRARIKIGKISEFGLLEMSRQCLRQSLMETNTDICPACFGSGRLLSCSVKTLQALRDLERWAVTANEKNSVLHASGPTDVVMAIFNRHRSYLSHIEKQYQCTIQLTIDETLSVVTQTPLTLLLPVPQDTPVITDASTSQTKAKKKKPRRKKKNGTTEISLLSTQIVESVQELHPLHNAPINTQHDDVTGRSDFVQEPHVDPSKTSYSSAKTTLLISESIPASTHSPGSNLVTLPLSSPPTTSNNTNVSTEGHNTRTKPKRRRRAKHNHTIKNPNSASVASTDNVRSAASLNSLPPQEPPSVSLQDPAKKEQKQKSHTGSSRRPSREKKPKDQDKGIIMLPIKRS